MNYFTSDLHFFHNRICELTERKHFTTQEEHTDWVIDILNSQAGKNDTIFHLGDFCFKPSVSTWESIICRINARLVMIRGNHDSEDALKVMKSKGLIQNWHDYLETKIDGQKVCMFHFPIMAWNKQHYGSIHCHGHSHGGLKPIGKMIDVGLDSAYKILGEHHMFTEQDILSDVAKRGLIVQESHRQDKSQTKE